jgi:hypothetical protein
MSYPLIILGAGASFDSDIPERYYDPQIIVTMRNHTPPVTKDLFNRTQEPIKIALDKYQEVSQLATHANRRIAATQDLESYLEGIVKIAPNNKDRYKELIGLRFYLADLFKVISEKFHQSENNYLALLKEIQDKSEGRACFINFNYDFLLEKNIPSIANADEIEKLITGNIKIIKIHGSCNWLFNPQINLKSDIINNGYDYYINQAESIFQEDLIEIMPTFSKDLKWSYYKKKNNSFLYEYVFYMPALAVPLPGDLKHIICPDSHIKVMKNCIEQADRILIIGWQGNDSYLVNLIKEKIGNKNIRLYVVSRDKNNADKITSKFSDTKFEIKGCSSNGFSVFLQSQELDNFFN